MKIETLFRNKSINHIHKISLIFIASFAILFTIILLYNMYVEYKAEVKQLENNYIDNQKIFIKDETLRALRYIKYKYNKNNNLNLYYLFRGEKEALVAYVIRSITIVNIMNIAYK